MQNTRCKDYISEKFYNVFTTQSSIPVAFGAPKVDYEAVAPPHSFIHVSDFKDAQSLADYLLYLRSNTTAYAEYFWWTAYYKVQKTDRACAVCHWLHDIKDGKVKTSRIGDFNQYWINEADCNNPKNTPWNL